MQLLGHESMVTSQRYVTAAGAETRTASSAKQAVWSARKVAVSKLAYGSSGWLGDIVVLNAM